jgi:hypothetical protein
VENGENGADCKEEERDEFEGAGKRKYLSVIKARVLLAGKCLSGR